MSSWRLLVHVHTRHSLDCLSRPEAVARAAHALGVEVLAVTDHDTWRGSLDVRAAAQSEGLPLRVIAATEANTTSGDLIGLFLRAETRMASGPAFCDAVHEQGGLVLLPHPFRGHRLEESLLSRIDLVETFNSRAPEPANRRAAQLASERGLPELVGPDAHRISEMSLAWVEFFGPLPSDDAGLRAAMLAAPRTFHARPSSIWSEWLSQLVKLSRRPNAALAWHLARGAVRRVVKPKAYRTG